MVAIVLGLVGAGGVAANPIQMGSGADCIASARGPADDLTERGECVADCAMQEGCAVSVCSGSMDVNECLSLAPADLSCTGTIPVTAEVSGNGGGSYQFYKNAFGDVFVRWAMQTNNIANGADGWVFGAAAPSASSASIWKYRASTTCLPIGSCSSWCEYLVDGGAWGWSSSSSCSVTWAWEVSVGVKFTITGVAGGDVTGKLGSSRTCSDGTEFDSESLFYDRGETLL